MDGAHTKIWNECLAIFRDVLDEATFNTWFEPIEPISYEYPTLTIKVPSMFFLEYLEEHFIVLISKTLRRVIGDKAKLLYNVDFTDEKMPKKKNNSILLPASKPVNTKNKETSLEINSEQKPNPFIVPGIKKVTINSQLNKNYTFDNLIEGSCNTVGINAGLKLAQNPDKLQFSPLFIHGPSGVGKTHLANAIGLKAKELNSDLIVLYTNAHEFQSQYTQAIRNKTVSDFIAFYKNIDILIVDDI
jgi:chromosomal replication initiator protein